MLKEDPGKKKFEGKQLQIHKMLYPPWKTGGSQRTDLCRESGISRKTGNRLLEMYEK
jgi:hypothetical protein